MFQGLKNSSVMTRLALGLATVLACAALTAMTAWYGLSQARSQMAQVQSHTVPALKAVLGVMADVRQGRLLELQLIAQRTEDARHAQEAELLSSRRAVERALRQYRPLDALDQTHADQILRTTLAHWAAQDQVLAASRRALEGSVSSDSVAQLSQGPSLQSYSALSLALEAWRQHGDQFAEQSSQAASGAAQGLERWVAVALLFAVAAAVVTLMKLTRAIVGPLQHAMKALRCLADGEHFRVKIRRRDELGRLLAAIDDLREVMVPMGLRDEDDLQEQAQPMEVRPALALSGMVAKSAPETANQDGLVRAPDRVVQRPGISLGAISPAT